MFICPYLLSQDHCIHRRSDPAVNKTVGCQMYDRTGHGPYGFVHQLLARQTSGRRGEGISSRSTGCTFDELQYVASGIKWIDATCCCPVRSKPYLSDFSSSEGPGSGTIEVNPGGIMCPPFVVRYNSVCFAPPPVLIRLLSLSSMCMHAALTEMLWWHCQLCPVQVISVTPSETPVLRQCHLTKPCMVKMCCQGSLPG